MSRKYFLVLFVLLWAGCVYEGKSLNEYFDNPREFIKDPHFETYQQRRDALESQYLNKEISYPEYVEGMETLDQKYAREVEERNRKLAE